MSVENEITLALMTVFSLMLFVMFFYVSIKQRSITDRYRLKYGFDKDIELKEIGNPKNLEKREQNFKRRTFKD